MHLYLVLSVMQMSPTHRVLAFPGAKGLASFSALEFSDQPLNLFSLRLLASSCSWHRLPLRA